MHEPLGVIGIACPDEAPLLAFISLLASAVAMGNRVVVIPSENHPLAATDFYQVLETSDVPDGVVNIVTGARDPLALVLAQHANVEAMWSFGGDAKPIEAASAADLKRTWTSGPVAWFDAHEGEGRHFLRQATQVKNIWIPYGA
jgi:aldehyde dehydrogenase (NAD+)